MPKPKPARRTNTTTRWRPHAPSQRQLYTAVDHGYPVRIDPENFAPAQRGAGWGPFAELFIRANRDAFTALDLQCEVSGGAEGVEVRLRPGGRAGAIPLCSPQNGRPAGGFVVTPRFGWAGVGRVLKETGWHAGPEFIEQPLVPGSGREVPSWVLAGPVLSRLEALLRSMRRGYREEEQVLTRPRGRILWSRYRNESLSRGRWDHLPCRFPDLEFDPITRRQIRWTLERLHRDLLNVGEKDEIALGLAAFAARLIDQVGDVPPLFPSSGGLERQLRGSQIVNIVLRRGLEAIAWIVDERGLGGGQEQDGLAWTLPLERLWESYVEGLYRSEAKNTGAAVKSGRLRQTTFPIEWSDPTHRSLGHLVPDLVLQKGRQVQIIDAKYKSHLAELDEAGWHRFEQENKEAHRADIHQVLAYASLFDADEITATLVYPLRASTFESLKGRRRDVSEAELFHGGRRIRLQLRGLPFGNPRPSPQSVE